MSKDWHITVGVIGLSIEVLSLSFSYAYCKGCRDGQADVVFILISCSESVRGTRVKELLEKLPSFMHQNVRANNVI